MGLEYADIELTRRNELVSILLGCIKSLCTQLGLDPSTPPEQVLAVMASESTHIFRFIQQQNPALYENLKIGKTKAVSFTVNSLVAQKRKEAESKIKKAPTFFSEDSQEGDEAGETNQSFFKMEESNLLKENSEDE